MSARLCCRALSPSIKKMCSPPLGVSSYHNSSVKQAESSKAPSSKPTSKPKPSGQEAKDTENKTYVSGDAFFSHNEYSFYDLEMTMEKDRIVQPSSEKIKLHCQDKLNPRVSRDLLPDPYGFMVEWPGKMDYQIGPVPPRVDGKYQVFDDGHRGREGRCCYDKIPL